MSNTPQSFQRKIHLISLGCARNRVDSEVMLGVLFEKGWVYTQNSKDANAIVVNTCGFIEAAKEESVDTILKYAQLKQDNPSLKLIVTGCLTQRYKHQLAKALPEVDFFIGTDEFPKIAEIIEQDESKGNIFAKRSYYIYNEKLPRINTLTKYAAYVKIAEGCQHNCAFCIIPAIRGKLRSRPHASIIAEVSSLVKQGIIEINLIAQDLAAYGRDNKNSNDNLISLLNSLCAIEDLKWIRLLYMYPENINNDFLKLISSQKKILKYLDIPVQHASNKILKKMNRDVSKEQIESTINNLRKHVPGIVIRTSVMTGFPGETEEDFKQLCDFVKKIKFDHLGCFIYSKEEGTLAARMQEQVDEKLKKQRRDTVMEIQQEISMQKLSQYHNKQIEVLLDRPQKNEKGYWVARSKGQAPEVDGVVYIDGKLDPTCDNLKKVTVIDSLEYDLLAKPA
jgi:ribosomal protein S12 methylthiotransferase